VLQAADARKAGSGKTKFALFGRKSADSFAPGREAGGGEEQQQQQHSVHASLDSSLGGSKRSPGNILARLLSRSSSKKKDRAATAAASAAASPAVSGSSGAADASSAGGASPVAPKQRLLQRFDSLGAEDYMDSDYESMHSRGNSAASTPKARDGGDQHFSSPTGFGVGGDRLGPRQRARLPSRPPGRHQEAPCASALAWLEPGLAGALPWPGWSRAWLETSAPAAAPLPHRTTSTAWTSPPASSTQRART
jgi:hypothetical protein